MAFVHLHLHTEFSLLDGVCRISKLPEYVKSLGQTAVAITDHGVLYGAVDFYKSCKKAGIKPIIGCEVYVAPRKLQQKEVKVDDHPYHLVLLCRNAQGYRNLCYMVTLAHTEGFYHKPRIDMALLQEHSAGLIALSGCIAGEIPRFLGNGQYEEAKKRALRMQEIFGVDGYYLEIQDHYLPVEQTVNKELLRLHKETGIPLVATNDAHYLRREDRDLQDVLMCIQMDKSLNDPKRLRFQSGELYVKSEAEMRELFPQCPEAIDNTQKIADLCQFDFQFGTYHLPQFPLPPQYPNSMACLRELCYDGFQKRYPSPPEDYVKRLEFELNMIEQMGFVDYFLIVADFIDFARGKKIAVGPGRGSAAGSIVSYCLYITNIDPMKFALYFERFLNPERISMPDIDIDFCIHRRGEVIAYVAKKYGSQHVAQIVTFGTLKARGVIRDVCRVMDIPYNKASILAKNVPPDPTITLKTALELSPYLKEQYQKDPEVKQLMDTALALEGLPRNVSTHAAGVVITKEPLHHYVPLIDGEKSNLTQFVMTTLEELGLLKMDFLGLRNLSVIEDCMQIIQKKYPNKQISVDRIPDNDSATMTMISRGLTAGVFQLESSGMRQVCIDLKPRNLDDIAATIALYRPGPMESIPRFIACKHNPQLISYQHPSLEPILSITYGCIVYQEQVIEIFRQLAGYSLGQADTMRRAISKKKGSEIEKERQSFLHGDPSRNISGCIANNIPENIAVNIFKEIFDFANYAFNKAHAVAYGMVTYQTGFLKCHFPKEYMSALLSSVLNNSDKVVEYIAECKNMGIVLLSPDINESESGFSPTDKGIRFGLVAIKGVGQAVIEKLCQERVTGGLFESFEDFCSRMYNSDLKRHVVENLIVCGAFDSMNYRRSQLLAVFETVLNNIQNGRKSTLSGQMDLFSQNNHKYELTLPDIPELPHTELLRLEKKTTGLFLSGHPMKNFQRHARELHSISIHVIQASFAQDTVKQQFRDGQEVRIAGVITKNVSKTTKKNNFITFVTLEDETASLELVVFSNVIERFGNLVFEGNAVMAMGRLSVHEEKSPQILVNSFVQLEEREVLQTDGSTLYLRIDSMRNPVFDKLKTLLELFPGDQEVILYYVDTAVKQQGFCEISMHLLDELHLLLGEDNVVIR